MKAFNNWYGNIEKEYPLHQDKDGYNIGNTRALKVGWKAALEWILKVKKSGDKLAYYNDDILMAIESEIKKELEE